MECSSTLSKFCWRMLELPGVSVLQRRKPCPLALLSRHGTEHLLLLARVQRRVILWVYTRLSICSWKWIICSLVVQKGLPAPTVRGSSGFLWWNVPASAPARQRLGASSRWFRGRGIRKISNYHKKNIQLFFFLLLLLLAAPPSHSALAPTSQPQAGELYVGDAVSHQLQPAFSGGPLGCWESSGRLQYWLSEQVFSRNFNKLLEKYINFPLTHIYLFQKLQHSNIILFCPTYFSERKYLLGFEQEYYQSWCCSVGLAYFYLSFLEHLQLTVFLQNRFVAVAASLLSQRNTSRTALPRHGQFSDSS